MSKLRMLKASLLVGFILSSSGLFGREAIIVDFANGADGRTSRGLTPADSNRGESVAEPSKERDQGDSHLAPSGAVFDLLSAELAMRANSHSTPVEKSVPDSLPTTGMHIPTWMQPKRPVLTSQFQSAALFSSNLSGGNFDHCDGGGFAPAWWLDPKVEARRAYHYVMVAAVACEYGVPTALLDAVIAQESGYKYWAISPKGAMGMMQIMPGTATQLGLADPFNALANIRAGARYLREQLDRFGRVDLALAAYNAGPYRRSLKEGRLPMISETLNYVRTIMGNWARLSPRTVEIATVDRGAIAAAAIANSGFRGVSLVRYDNSSSSSAVLPLTLMR